MAAMKNDVSATLDCNRLTRDIPRLTGEAGDWIVPIVSIVPTSQPLSFTRRCYCLLPSSHSSLPLSAADRLGQVTIGGIGDALRLFD